MLDAPQGERAREILADARKLLEEIVAGGLLRARAVYDIFPTQVEGDDIPLFGDEARSRPQATLHGLRQQEDRGDYLKGWYTDWCLLERERLVGLHLVMLNKLSAWCAGRSRFEEGMAYAYRALDHARPTSAATAP